MLLTSQLAPRPLQTTHTAMTILAGLLVVLSVLGSLPLVGLQIPLWCQPSLVGLLWGSLFLSGCWLAFAGQSNLLHLALVGCSFTALTFSFHRITDLNFEESLITAVILTTCGWIAMRFDRGPRISITRQQPGVNGRQIPLMDLFVATTLVACAARAWTHMSSPSTILLGILGTLIVGCCCCWAVYHWAWNDQRPVGLPLFGVVLLSTIGVLLVMRASPLSPTELVHWLLVGPLSVLAAQCFTVLAVLAVMRWRVRLSQKSLAASNS